MDEFTRTYNTIKNPLENLLDHSKYDNGFSLNDRSSDGNNIFFIKQYLKSNYRGYH